MSEKLPATWQDPPWNERTSGIPDPLLLTRAEVLDEAQRLGLDVDERDLRYWEAEGILPRPLRRHYQGATRAVYPSWYIDLIYKLRRLQGYNLSLKELPQRLQAESRRLSRTASERGHPSQPPPPEPPPGFDFTLWDFINRDSKYRQAMRQYMIASLPFPSAPFPALNDPLVVPQETALHLARIVSVIAQVYAEEGGIDITRAALHLTDRHGRGLPPFEIPVLYESSKTVGEGKE